MISLKNPEQIGKMRDAGALLYEVLCRLREAVQPGMSTAALDVYAEQLIRKNHAIPSFLHYEGYPASICASIDDAVVHGIPSEKQILREGQILSIDCGLVLDGWQADSAFTMGIGEISPEAQRLIDVTEQCFFAGARQAIAGKRLGDVGHAVQQVAESNGYGVIRDLTGHGIGREMHEDPPVFNYGTPDRGLRLRKGMTIAIEPMISAGDWHITCDADQWCYRTRDRSLTSHYEHTIAINEDGLPEILTYPDFNGRTMMNRLTMEPGRVVQSTQGRDAGRYFVVLQVVDDRHVLMADGQSRKIDHPKKKKMMHLRPKPIVVNVEPQALENKHLQDSDLRKALSAHGLSLKAQNEQPHAEAAAAGADKED